MNVLIIPAENMAAVTPHDTTALAEPCRALYVGTAGNVKIKTIMNQDITLVGAAAGTIYPVRAILVFSTGTTASDIVAIF